jgi:hypothetical protein
VSDLGTVGKPYLSLTIFYDGDCPLCSRYALYQQLQEAADAVDLVNARHMSADDFELLARQGVDVNDGIVVKVRDVAGREFVYSGKSSLAFLARFDQRSGALGQLHRWFQRSWFAPAAYPLLFQGRRLLLFAIRVPTRIRPVR